MRKGQKTNRGWIAATFEIPPGIHAPASGFWPPPSRELAYTVQLDGSGAWHWMKDLEPAGGAVPVVKYNRRKANRELIALLATTINNDSMVARLVNGVTTGRPVTCGWVASLRRRGYVPEKGVRATLEDVKELARQGVHFKEAAKCLKTSERSLSNFLIAHGYGQPGTRRAWIDLKMELRNEDHQRERARPASD